MLRSDWRARAVVLRPATAFACAMMIWAGSGVAYAESLPASIRACAREPDSLKRLICFDKEVARYGDDSGSGDARRAPPPIGGAPIGGAPIAPAPSTASAPAAAPAPAPAAAQADAPKVPKHISAKVERIENFPDAVVLHLDNGQVWEQIQEASADLNLHAGDTVSIDRELGSYWLAGKSGTAMKVRQKK